MFVAQYSAFLEKEFILKRASGSGIDIQEVPESKDAKPEVELDNQEDVDESQQAAKTPVETPSIRRSGRIHREPERYGFVMTRYEIFVVDHDEPATYREVVSDLEFDKWFEAMNVEIQSMYDNQVWNLVDAPKNSRTVGCKWVFKKKIDMDGKVHTYKA